jgi:glucosamine--fructose-6-phosphate aminotransferase (isomerizing)
MCGIFGIIAKAESGVSLPLAESVIRELFILSETRGKESSGIAVRCSADRTLHVTKDDVPASELIASKTYRDFLDKALKPAFVGAQQELAVIAHSRLVTNGTQEHNFNNQPCIKDGIVMVHNGIVTNVDALWAKYADRIERKYEVDTEVLAAMFRLFLKEGMGPVEAIRRVFQEMEGAASVAMLINDARQVLLATNTGSMYFVEDGAGSLVFASEEYITRTFTQRDGVKERYAGKAVEWLQPFTGKVIDLESWSVADFGLKDATPGPALKTIAPFTITDHSKGAGQKEAPAVATSDEGRLRKLIVFPEEVMRSIRRCTKCLLPETFPYIHYDGAGVCNYCHSYQPKGLTVDKRPQFEEVLKKYRRNDGKQDCIVAFSGGRDSSYGLHLLVKEFGMTPLTFTYDWGLVTDLARRNIARMTGKLGVENILVSADIKMKRRNVRLNMEAWLKSPRLGMIPLFMAGDKHFFVHVNNIRRQTGIHCDIWMENKLENTDFKAGFAGIRPNFEKERIDKQSTLAKFQMPLYYMRNFLANPGYLNVSLPDTYSAFKAYYTEPREVYLLLFDYIPWNEESLDRTLKDEYNWEISPDTTSTWRIGDGTAAFYNYVYGLVAGFTEFDTFRSNQIREGMITREEGLAHVLRENRPRFESMMWYFETIGVDMERALKVINAMPRLYHQGNQA